MMEKREYTIRFVTPAFLGDAEQSGRWRTPPFKHLLREWWRVAYATAHGFDVDTARMRAEEGALFGSAADGTGNRSRVRIRLGQWDKGRMDHWVEDPKVYHKEVGPGGKKVGSHLYLGFGPLNFHNHTYLGRKDENNQFKPHAAIQAGETAELRLAFPKDSASLLDTAVTLMDRYGTLGGRSRNGWGSFNLEPSTDTPPLDPMVPLRPLEQALQFDWPHAVGEDESGPLVWQTAPVNDWKGLMRQLAEVKIGLRTQFTFNSGKGASAPEERHWLAYPVTNHAIRGWGNNARLPNTLRFKVRADDNGKLRGVIFHVPCRPPRDPFHPDLDAIKRVWRQVHRFLDDAKDIERCS